MTVPPVEVLRYFLQVCEVFGKRRVFRSKFFTQEFWSSQFENNRKLQCMVWIRFTVSENELQRDYSWLDSELQGEREVQPGIFFGNAEHCESDEIFLRKGNVRIKGEVYSESEHTRLDSETPPELFMEELWHSHREWFEDRAI